MKKRRILIIVLLVIVIITVVISLWKTQNGSELKISPYTEVNNLVGVSMDVIPDTVSSKGLKVIFENITDETYIYGTPYYLEIKIDNKWYKLPIIFEGDYGWNMVAYDLVKDRRSEWTVNWEWLYGVLEPGQYRIIKQIDDDKSSEEKIYFLAAEFQI